MKGYFYGALAILLLAILSYMYYLKTDRDKYQAQVKKEQEKTEQALFTNKQLLANAESDHKLLEGYQNAKTDIQYVDKIVTEQVIQYRDVVTTRFVIPAEFVRAYNGSTERVHTPDTAPGTNDRAPVIAKIVNDADLLETVTSNNRLCIKQAEQLSTLQKWAQ